MLLLSACILCCAVCIKDYQSREAIHELGGIPPLLELLKSDFPVIQHLALKTLYNVTTDRDTRDTFREEQGFEKLMDVLSNTVGRGEHMLLWFHVYVCLHSAP